jgi:hypothetical protein
MAAQPLYRWEISDREDIAKLGQLLLPFLGAVKLEQLEGVLRVGRSQPLPWDGLSNEERYAWAAGFWDGEGSICLLKHRSHFGHFVPEASVTQSSDVGIPEVLARMSTIASPGFLYGPFPQEPPLSPVYRWKLFRRDEIEELVALMRPWLGAVKQSQAERVLDVLAAQPKLARGNPGWGSHKTHCIRGDEYLFARIRPFRGRGKNTEPPRASHQCLACVREDARSRRLVRNRKNGG